MKKINLVKIFLIFTLFSSQGYAASLQGKVELPDPKRESGTTERYQTNTSKPVAAPESPRAIVYLEGDYSSNPKKSSPRTLRQKGYRFVPRTLAVPKGGEVQFVNEDEDYHNILSYSKTKRFDLGRYRKDDTAPKVMFDKTGLVKIYCEIHKHMRGQILVIDSPYFTESSPEGNYELKDLPGGTHTVVAWIDKKTQLRKEVTLTEDETLTLDFLL